MEKDVLVILMIAFGIFAVAMFILFYAYLKKYYNGKHIEQDYEKDLVKNEIDEDVVSSNEDSFVSSKKEDIVDKDVLFTPLVDDNNDVEFDNEYNEYEEIEEGFIPIKKK